MTRTILAALVAAASLAAPAARADDFAAGADLGPSLRLYGFADFGYSKYFIDEDSNWAAYLPEHGAFSVGNLNLYLDGQLSDRARSLVEIRFTYLPNGAVVGLGPSLSIQTNGSTLVPDPTRNSLTSLSWGGIVIERAWAEYTVSELLTIRAGQFLTPYGIWNVDHGSPVIVGIARPHIINAYLFPERQMGLEAYGARYLGATRVGWHLTLSNGRNENDPNDASRSSMPQWTDYDGQFGYGARLYAETEAFGDLRAGVSGYAGRFTARTTSIAIGGPTTPTTTIARQFDEWAAGADVRWSLGAWLVQGEAVWQSWKNTDENPTEPGAESGRSGAYVLVGFRLPWNTMPFVMAQYFDPNHRDSRTQVWGGEAGVNVQLQPNLVLKASYSYYESPRSPDTSLTADPVSAAMSQLAWAF